MKIGIVGGGIGGLAAACALALRGHEPLVFEQAPQLTEIGAGLQISANGWRVLDALGVAEPLWPEVFEPPTIEMRLGRSGRRIWRLPMGRVSRPVWGGPYVQAHRADLVEVLAARLEALAPGALHTGAVVKGYESAGMPRLIFENADEVQVDLIIAADGVHSRLRQQMLGPETPRYTGNIAWRCLVPADALGADAPPANTTIWAGQGRHAVTTRVRGGSVVNFVGLVEQPQPAEESWRSVGARAEAQADFDGWARPIAQILERAETLNRWALFTRPPLPRWSDGAVVLMGDAAHPMLPSMAQGAVQALEDAWILAAMLERRAPDEVGGVFHAHRIERVSRIQAASADNARMFHRASPLGTLVYYGGMAAVTRIAPSLLLRRQDWVYREDVVAAHPL